VRASERRGFHALAVSAALATALLVVSAAAAVAQAPALGDRPVAPKPAKSASSTRPPGVPVSEIAAEAKSYDDAGAYGRAAETLRELRQRVKPDLDLDIALALAEARSGHSDAAWALLTSPAANAAGADSMPQSRRHDYPWNRDTQWTNGTFDGWYWYLHRARAEIAAARGQWNVAHENARASVAARPIAGKEWLILALCAGHDGDMEGARHAARTALELDPTLPEANYLNGLLAWGDGRRAEAQELFHTALALDSTYAAAATALVRCRLPFAKADSLPAALFLGARKAGLLSSAVRPKLEEFVQMDTPTTITRPIYAAIPDSLRRGLPPLTITLPVLVDAHGRVVLHELPWFEANRLPAPALAILLSTLPMWRFSPALRHNDPQTVWTAISLSLDSAH